MMSLKGVRSATTLSDLARELKDAAKTIDKDVSAIAKVIALRLSFRLIYETPVDTSQALSNWTVNIGAPYTGRRSAYAEGSQGSTYGQSTAAAYGAALMRLGNKKPKQVIHVTNNLGYVTELNRGKSRQAPAGYVQAIESSIQQEADTLLRNYLEGR